jgi:hypothetical protein
LGGEAVRCGLLGGGMEVYERLSRPVVGEVIAVKRAANRLYCLVYAADVRVRTAGKLAVINIESARD